VILGTRAAAMHRSKVRLKSRGSIGVPLAASLKDFVGHPAYGTTQLRADLDRFTFLLGGSDGEDLFGSQP
jgi:hypothetical protein